jgi:hypothetical protein
MLPNTPSSPAPAPPTPAPPRPAKKSPWLLYGCGGFLALLLVIVATILITFWWIQRPIKPVVLSGREKAAVDQKLQRLEGGNVPDKIPPIANNTPLASNSANNSTTTPPPIAGAGAEDDPRKLRLYLPGSKVLKLSEREVNGLLNLNTDLGKAVRLEFAQDAINAYLAVRIPDDFPVAGGKMFRARGRFRVSLGNGGAPYAILEDVTVFGLSLPKAWLGGLKGENLIGDAVGGPGRAKGLKGIKSLRVEPGELVLEVED